jgi:hypothetical protein
LATLWVAAGSHCLLEVLPGFEFLSCCQHPETEKTPAHHEKDCGGDACVTIELGFYKAAQPQSALLKPSLSFVAWLIASPDVCLAGPSDSLLSVSSSPPELVRFWQFFQRTALPPRAPSFVS